MIAILSPAKTINMDKSRNTNVHSEPLFIDEAALLIEELKKYSPPEMESLMKINSELAEANFRRHIMWNKKHTTKTSKQSLLAYNGMVYQGLDAKSLKDAHMIYAQDHLRILSGLYGVLRPLDLIQPYRLEMATKLNNIRGKDLYVFWKDTITNYFMEELNKQNNPILINLASNEYSSAIDLKKLKYKTITPVFKDYSKGSFKVITIYAKKARGLMARFIVENEIDNLEDLKEFNDGGYSFDEHKSTDSQWVFINSSVN